MVGASHQFPVIGRERNQSHKDNLRHLPRLPGFFVTCKVLSVIIVWRGESEPSSTATRKTKEDLLAEGHDGLCGACRVEHLST